MAENSKLTGIELNGVLYSLGKSIYEELDISLVRFAELLGRDFYCPTLSSAPTSSTISYTDTDGETQSFQIGQPCRWAEGDGWRLALCTDNAGDSASWLVLPSAFLTDEMIAGKQDKSIKFENIPASVWVSDSTYADYPYRCDVVCLGVTDQCYADVVFSVSDVMSGDYAPVCETKADAVSVWSKKEKEILIPTIVITL